MIMTESQADHDQSSADVRLNKHFVAHFRLGEYSILKLREIIANTRQYMWTWRSAAHNRYVYTYTYALRGLSRAATIAPCSE